LLEWKITIPIFLTSTAVKDGLLKEFDATSRNGKVKTILYLARIEKEKGVFIAIEAFQLLKKNHPYLKMRIVGYGKAFDPARRMVEQNDIRDIEFTGNLAGSDLIRQFIQSDIYIYPTYYGEGMPTSVLEAMVFGLPVITRPVGGLVDFFKSGEMGELIESLDPLDFANSIEGYINNPDLVKAISLHNYNYAQEHFLASRVARQIETYCRSFSDNIIDKS
jgi:glycosyltransferase involved in cell wall biosynthesis